MAGQTVTRAQLSEAVYQEVGLSRNEFGRAGGDRAGRDFRCPCARRDGQDFLLRQLRRAQERQAHRPQSQDRDRGADQPAPRAGVSRLARAEGSDQRRARAEIDRRAAAARHEHARPVRSAAAQASPPRRASKSAEAFRTISEVAGDLEVPQHVLRFWESKFPQIKPLKRAGGRRYYRPDDVALLRRIRQCLYDQGYTIKGVQKLLREGALKAEARGASPVPATAAARAEPRRAKSSAGRTARGPHRPAQGAGRAARQHRQAQALSAVTLRGDRRVSIVHMSGSSAAW